MTVKAEFVISARDKTAEAVDSAKRRLDSLGHAATMLKGAFGAYLFVDFMRAVADTEIKLQSMQFTLLAATGSMQGSAQQMQFLAAVADKLGISISDVGQYYARMAVVAKESGIPLKTFQGQFVAISSAMRVLHLDTRHTQMAWLALQEIMSQGTVKTRHLTRQLSIDFPSALQAAAQGMGKTTAQLLNMAKAGKLMSSEFMPGLAKGLMQLYGPSVQIASQGLQASLTRVKNAFTEAVLASQQTGAFNQFDSALDQLAETLKSPAFQQSFAAFLNGMARLATMTAAGFEHTVDLAQKWADIMNHTKGGLRIGTAAPITGPAERQLAAAQKNYMDLYHYQHASLMGVRFDRRLSPAQTVRAKNLLALIANLKREISAGKGKEESSLFASAVPGGGSAGQRNIAPLSTGEQTGLQTLSGLLNQTEAKIAGFKTTMQNAQEAMKSFKPGTAAYNEASAMVAQIKKETAQVDALTNAKKHSAGASKMVSAADKASAAAKKVQVAEMKQELAAEQKYMDALKKDAQQWIATLDQAAKFKIEKSKLEAEHQYGMLSDSQFKQASSQNKQSFQAAQGQVLMKSQFGQWTKLATDAAHQMADAFEQFFYDPVKDGFSGLLSSFVDLIRQMVAKWLAAQALMAIGRAFGGGGSNPTGFWGAVGSMFMQAGNAEMGGGKASGGSVRAGVIYPVGERGPELFVPTTSGHILPNGQAFGRGTTINIDARGAGPDEVSKLALIAGNLRTQMRADVLHYNAYGHFPAA